MAKIITESCILTIYNIIKSLNTVLPHTSVLRNLSWRTDSRSKAALRRVCAAKRLTIAAMSAQRESTLRTTLSALWNLSAHCSQNKRAVCRPCTPLVWNQGFPTPLGRSSTSINPVKGSDIRFSSSQFHKQQ
ncbi:unnamed protein product [Schistosoma mattheei]|uniref:Uncharacterized protein n=1 Tax=Schistosoma mattheei TaxID=31246 RepID=A0A3P7YLU0_9TREM|nr:unnamed protein product [Schistosoma mattheei]